MDDGPGPVLEGAICQEPGAARLDIVSAAPRALPKQERTYFQRTARKRAETASTRLPLKEARSGALFPQSQSPYVLVQPE